MLFERAQEPYPTHYALNKTHIDIWQYPLSIEPSWALSLLSEDERQRANQFYFERHRRRFIVARAIMRTILARYIDRHPKNLVFQYNDYGKPSLHDLSQIQFNISHSQELALLAVGKTTPLGIDLEFYADRPYQGIGEHSFSIQENQQLQATPLLLQPLVFFHTWSQKEAFIKACGMGLSYQTQTFTVPALPPTNQTIFDVRHQCHWQLQSFMPAIGCCAALCYDPVIQSFMYHTLNQPLLQELYS